MVINHPISLKEPIQPQIKPISFLSPTESSFSPFLNPLWERGNPTIGGEAVITGARKSLRRRRRTTSHMLFDLSHTGHCCAR